MKNAIGFLGWLKRLMFLWVRSKLLPQDLQASLKIDPHKPVVYALKSRSLTDLLLLDHYCEKFALPRPLFKLEALSQQNPGAAYLALTTPGLFSQKRSKNLPKALYQLVEKAGREQLDIQLVPVSVFWGRNPGREEKSLFKLLFFDEEHGGLLQRFVTFFVQGRNVFCNFGKPLSLAELRKEGLSVEEATKKLRRILRVHFRRQRETIVGPYLYDRQQVIESLLQSKAVRDAMAYEAKKKNLPLSRLEPQARRYADEVCAKVSYHAIRFFDVLLTWLCRKVYDSVEVKRGDKIRELAEDFELVYMPSHRSHWDYLLIGYVLYHLGLLPPHTIAGINLNFWPVGPLLRRGGGIFIRRTFRGNRLYGVVVSEFMRFLLMRGFPLCFYPEGGRSRNGLLLPPKLGILSMIIESSQKSTKKPVLLVPIYVTYDRLMEERSYVKELQGKAKKSESLGQLFKAFKVMRMSFGRAYISFGRPVELADYWARYQQQAGTLAEEGEEAKPRSLTPFVAKIAQEVMVRINSATIVSPTAIFAAILLAAPKKAMSEEDLLGFSGILVKLFNRGAYDLEQGHTPANDELMKALHHIDKLTPIIRFHHPTGDIFYLNESESIRLAYYRNNILHLFVLPALLATLVQPHAMLARSRLEEACCHLYGFVRQELFLPWQEQEVGPIITTIVESMLGLGLLVSVEDKAGYIQKPTILDREFSYLRILARIQSPSFEKFALYAALLSRYQELGHVKQESWQEECLLMGQRLSLINGMTEGALFDERSFTAFLNLLLDKGGLKRQDDKHLQLTEKLEPSMGMLMELLSPEVRQSLCRTPLSAGKHKA